MLFLGLGTGLGSAMIVDGILQPMELAHLGYKNGKSYEDYLGLRGLERMGKKKWRQEVAHCVGGLVPALQLDDVVLGGGNVKKLTRLPEGCRGGDNVDAFLGGFRLWEEEHLPRSSRSKPLVAVRKKSAPHQHQKTRIIQKDTMKGAAA